MAIPNTSNRRSMEMAISSRREKFLSIVPDHVSDKEHYLSQLAFETEVLIAENPRLASCDPKSLLLGAMNAARYRLSFRHGDCSLIPFKNTAVFVLGAPGIVKVLHNTGLFKRVKWGVFCEGDEFDYQEGGGLGGDYVRVKKALTGRGEVIGAYAIAEMNDNTCHIIVVDQKTLHQIRDSSPGYKKSDPSSPYNKWPEEMFGKAAIKRLMKRLPLDPAAGSDVGKALDAARADYTAAVEPDSAPVFFENVAPVKRRRRKKAEPPKREAVSMSDVAIEEQEAIEGNAEEVERDLQALISKAKVQLEKDEASRLARSEA